MFRRSILPGVSQKSKPLELWNALGPIIGLPFGQVSILGQLITRSKNTKYMYFNTLCFIETRLMNRLPGWLPFFSLVLSIG